MLTADLQLTRQPQLWELVLKTLRLQIFDGKIPPNTQLVEAELATLFGVSRGPIREALAHLEQERLVVREPRKGAFVEGLSENDVREIYGLRQILECYAAELSPGIFKDADLQRMRICIEQMVELRHASNWGESAELDLEFHRIPVRVSGHRRLLQGWDVLSGSTLTMNTVTAPSYPDLIGETQRGHGAILDAYRAGNAAAVQEAIAIHIRRVQEVMLGLMRFPKS